MTIPDHPRPLPKSFAVLECLRFLCALDVLIWHYQHFLMGSNGDLLPGMSRDLQPLSDLLWPIYTQGELAVVIFWQISGFIITWKYANRLNHRRLSFSGFWILRMSRLYPLHVATLFIVAALQLIYESGHGGGAFVYPANDAYHFVLNLAFASSWGLELDRSFNGPIWSVSVELLIYAIFCVIAVSIRSSALQSAAMAGLFVIGVGLSGDNGAATEITLCGVGFYLGALLYHVNASETLPFTRQIRLGLALPVAILFAIVVRQLPGLALARFAFFSSIFLASALLLATLPAIERAASRVSFLGDLTYSSYLVHFPMQLIAVITVDAIGWPRTLFLNPVALVTFLVTVMGVAHIVFHRFERPVQAILRAVTQNQSSTLQA